MRLVRDGGEDVGSPIEEIALVVTGTATVEMSYHAHKTRHGPLFVFSAPRKPEGAEIFGLVCNTCGCNPYIGHVVARSIEDARRVRDALSAAITHAEARA